VPLWGGGRAGSPSNTMWPGPRPIRTPSFILIRPTVWAQYTNVTDRQTDRHRTHRIERRSDSIWRTVLQMVAQKSSTGLIRFHLPLVCLTGLRLNIVLDTKIGHFRHVFPADLLATPTTGLLEVGGAGTFTSPL